MAFPRAAIVVGRLAVIGGLVGCGGDAVSNASATAEPAGTLAANASVANVVDGDTIDVVIDGREERVRLIGIDTPEIAHDAFAERPATDGECFGDAASAFTSSLLPTGTAVRLERDVVGRDDYGRLLAYVYRADDGVFVNREIVRRGYARPLTIAPNVAHSELFVEAARAAERADTGLWSACR
jgi:micrococcal nuclease